MVSLLLAGKKRPSMPTAVALIHGLEKLLTCDRRLDTAYFLGGPTDAGGCSVRPPWRTYHHTTLPAPTSGRGAGRYPGLRAVLATESLLAGQPGWIARRP